MSTTLGPMVPALTGISICLLSMMRLAVMDPALSFGPRILKASARLRTSHIRTPAQHRGGADKHRSCLAYPSWPSSAARSRRFRSPRGSGAILIAQACQGLLPPENGHDVEQPRRGCAPGKRGAQRLCRLAELHAERVGVGPHRGLERRRRPLGDGVQTLRHAGEALAPAAFEQRAGLVVEGERPLGVEVIRAVEKLDERLGALLQARHGGEELAAERLLDARADAARRPELRHDLV